jgi:uncharacterized protein involved in exopolysaccharide biosynthesis
VPVARQGEKLNPSYIDTYRQHRVLFMVPLLIGMIVAIWINLGAPSLYRSSTSLWSDTAGGSANDLSGAPPPAAQEQSMLNELLRTQYFVKSVAKGGPLNDYLEQHPSQGWGPGALVKKLRGAPTLDERITTALSPKRVTSLVLGPHVLKVSYDGPTPQVSYETLRVLIKRFETQRNALRADALNSYSAAVAAASRALNSARTNVSTYLREHPGATQTDPQLQSLTHAARNALDQLSGATQGLNQAATAGLGSSGTTLRVVDQPEVPLAAYGQHKRLAFGVFAGLFVGALVSFLAIFAMTKSGRTAVADVEVVRRGDVTAERQSARAEEPPVAASASVPQAHLRRRKRTG